MRSVESTLRWFPLYSGLSFTPVMIPVLVLFWVDNGLNTFEVYLLQSLFALAVVLLEVPTGMVADRMGKRMSILMGQCTVAVGCLLYAISGGFWSFLLCEVILALGMTLMSGADSALLFDCLKRLGREQELAEHEGRNQSVRMLVFAACNVIGGLLGAWSLRATVWAGVVGPLLAIFVVASFVEASPPPGDRSLAEAAGGYRQLMRDALQFVTRHRLVRWLLLFQAVLTGSATWLLWAYQPYMELSGLPLWAFGLAFAVYNLFAAACSRLAHRVGTRLGDGGTLVLLAALQALPPLLMAFWIGPASFLFVLGHQAVRGLGRPLLNARILAYTWPDKRATVLSLGSLAGRLFFALTGPIVGMLGEGALLPRALAIQGAVLVALFALLGWAYRSIPEKHFRVKAVGGDS